MDISSIVLDWVNNASHYRVDRQPLTLYSFMIAEDQLMVIDGVSNENILYYYTITWMDMSLNTVS